MLQNTLVYCKLQTGHFHHYTMLCCKFDFLFVFLNHNPLSNLSRQSNCSKSNLRKKSIVDMVVGYRGMLSTPVLLNPYSKDKKEISLTTEHAHKRTKIVLRSWLLWKVVLTISNRNNILKSYLFQELTENLKKKKLKSLFDNYWLKCIPTNFISVLFEFLSSPLLIKIKLF